MSPLLLFSVICVLGACSSAPAADETPKTDAPAPTATDVASAVPPHGARREISQDDCTAKGGTLVGDIGDGATHKPEFRCPSGSPPIGNVPLGVEGSVCCL
jgi:hypothetical protein